MPTWTPVPTPFEPPPITCTRGLYSNPDHAHAVIDLSFDGPVAVPSEPLPDPAFRIVIDLLFYHVTGISRPTPNVLRLTADSGDLVLPPEPNTLAYNPPPAVIYPDHGLVPTDAFEIALTPEFE